MAPRRRHLALLPTGFDPSLLPTAQLDAYNLAGRLVSFPEGREGGVLRSVQDAFKDEQFQRAVEILAKHLDEHGLRARGRQKFQNGRVAALRRLKDVTQHQLASAIGASPAQISQIENGMNFAVHRLLCICDFFDVSPSSFIEDLAAR